MKDTSLETKINRRDHLRGILLSCLSMSCMQCASPARGQTRYEGCRIAPEAVHQLRLSRNVPRQSGIRSSIGDAIIRSKDESFDRALGRVLVNMSRFFSVRPGFAYYDDRDAPNALATTERVLGAQDGSVLFGLHLLSRKMSDKDGGDIAVVAICAHEFAHITQFQYNLRMIKFIEERFPRYAVELHADFLAGVYLSHFIKFRPSVTLQGVGRAWERLGSSDFNRPGSHGTSRQRLAAIEGGFFFGRDDPNSPMQRASTAGLNFLDKIIS